MALATWFCPHREGFGREERRPVSDLGQVHLKAGHVKPHGLSFYHKYSAQWASTKMHQQKKRNPHQSRTEEQLGSSRAAAGRQPARATASAAAAASAASFEKWGLGNFPTGPIFLTQPLNREMSCGFALSSERKSSCRENFGFPALPSKIHSKVFLAPRSVCSTALSIPTEFAAVFLLNLKNGHSLCTHTTLQAGTDELLQQNAIVTGARHWCKTDLVLNPHFGECIHSQG